ncbi:MAG: hypothetical protein OIF57_04685 [Marinobacterium sp.]|nr:hypothetical protein [Marinobacterium sp.]
MPKSRRKRRSFQRAGFYPGRKLLLKLMNQLLISLIVEGIIGFFEDLL